MGESLMRRVEIEGQIGVSRATIYNWIRDGHFPKPIRIGPRAVRWRKSDIEKWIEGREAGAF